MSNSPLVNYTKISPNKTRNRTHAIDTVTIHCVVGQLSVEVLGAGFARSERKASSNYGIGPDGRIGMYVEEKDRAWTSSNWQNDNRAITIEVASDTKYPYAVKEAAYNALIDLLVDICQRNGIKKLLWKNDKSLIGQVDKQNMTVHRWFSSTACPGEYLFSRHGQIADAVNARLLGTSLPEESEKDKEFPDSINVPFTVNVKISDLEIRKGPGTKYDKTGKVTGKGVFTIVEVNDGWGKLKSGVGWIPLNLENPKEASEPASDEETSNGDSVEVPFTVTIKISDLSIRKGPGTEYDKTGKVTGKGAFTIVEVNNGWGKLKSGAGWIPLSLINPDESSGSTSSEKDVVEDVSGYTKIVGSSVATVEQMISRIKSANPSVPQSVIDMIPYYISEGKTEGIRGDIAFAQSCIETGNFAFPQSTCAVTIDQNNFAMMGVTSTYEKGESFDTPQLGIRAQIQHLKAYASTDDLVGECVDPRFTYVTRGCAPYVEWLGMQENPQGKGWASGKDYGSKILRVLDGILSAKVEEKSETTSEQESDTDEQSKAPYTVKVNISDLVIRKGPGVTYDKTGGVTGKGTFTIVEECAGWGKLKSGAGWIPLSLENPKETSEKVDTSFKVKVDISYLNIRKGPGMNYDKTGRKTGVGTFTIVEVQDGEGSNSGWGKLKSGAGWISLDYATKV